MGRLKHVDPAYPLPTTPAYTYAYEANSAALVATVTGPVHTVTNTWESTRDALDTKKNADTAGTPSVPSSFNYSVNNLGQRDLVGPMMDGGSPAAPISIHSVAWEWAYNDRGELESADHGDDGTANTKDRFYAFDAIGNRDYVREGVFTDSSGTQVQYTANALNQYTVANGVTLPTPAFDADGNNTNGPIPVATGNATLEWDAENRLVKVTRADSVVITYAYDYHGRRISKTVGGGTARHYFYEGWNPVAEYAGHTLDKTYLWGMDLSGSIQGAGGVGGLLAVKEGAYHYYPTFDGNGNVGEYLDAAGVSAAHYEYDAFGNTVASSGTKQSDFAHRFSTKFFDSESGFYYYGYRFYDPVTGRWPSRDPIEELGGTNLYAFLANDGISRVDALGLEDPVMEHHVNSCEIYIYIGHTVDKAPTTWHTPRSGACGWKAGVIGCNPEKANENIDSRKNQIPGIPDHNARMTYNASYYGEKGMDTTKTGTAGELHHFTGVRNVLGKDNMEKMLRDACTCKCAMVRLVIRIQQNSDFGHIAEWLEKEGYAGILKEFKESESPVFRKEFNCKDFR